MAIEPVQNPIINNIVVNYQYQISPTSPLTKASNISNTISIEVNTAELEATKSVEPIYAKVGTILTYTVTITNNGNVSGQNIVLIDTIPTNTTFVSDSLSINGLTTTSTPNFPGIYIPDIEVNDLATVTWQVIVDTIPTSGVIPSSAVTNYTYIVSPTSAPLNAGINTNIVLTTVNHAYIDYTYGSGLVNSANVNYAAVNDIITYTVSLRNTGNMTATNIVLYDTIPLETTFVNDSVTINGISQPGIILNSPIGAAIGSLAPNEISTLTFQVVVNSIPSTNNIINNSMVKYQFSENPSLVPITCYGNSNSTLTTIVQAYIDNSDGGLIKSLNKKYAKIGDILTYSVILKNTGNTTAKNIILKDTIPSGTTFIEDSFVANGAVQIGANPELGVNIDSLLPGAVMTTTFNVLVTSIPEINPASSIADVVYNFDVDPTNEPRTLIGSSNNVLFKINTAILTSITKTVNPKYIVPGDTLTYTISLINTGNVTANGVVLYDKIPKGTNFIENSVAINSVEVPESNPEDGLKLPSISPGETIIVTFKVITENKNTV